MPKGACSDCKVGTVEPAALPPAAHDVTADAAATAPFPFVSFPFPPRCSSGEASRHWTMLARLEASGVPGLAAAAEAAAEAALPPWGDLVSLWLPC